MSDDSRSDESPEDRSDDGSRSGRQRFIRASTGRPVIVTKPPLARFDSVDIDAPLASKWEAHARKLETRNPNIPSQFAVRDKDVPLPPDTLPETAKAQGGISAGPKHPFLEVDEEGHAPSRQQSMQSEKWSSFLLGTQFRKRLDDYLRGERDKEDNDNEKMGDSEKQASARRNGMHLDGIRRQDETLLTIKQTQTPGWNSPWSPHRRSYMDDFRQLGPSEGPNNIMLRQKKLPGFFNSLADFLVHSVWAPILLRLLNMAFTCALIGLAGKIQDIEDVNGVQGIIGESTIFALVVGSLTLIHVFIAIYLEYFGPPIGIWRMRTKMMHTLTELLFISLWAALLSLSFDDYFTTQATCTAWTPNARWRPVFGNSSVNGSVEDRLCDLQGALVAMVFVGLILYQAVLVISLFRIFYKMSHR